LASRQASSRRTRRTSKAEQKDEGGAAVHNQKKKSTKGGRRIAGCPGGEDASEKETIRGAKGKGKKGPKKSGDMCRGGGIGPTIGCPSSTASGRRGGPAEVLRGDD